MRDFQSFVINFWISLFSYMWQLLLRFHRNKTNTHSTHLMNFSPTICGWSIYRLLKPRGIEQCEWAGFPRFYFLLFWIPFFDAAVVGEADPQPTKNSQLLVLPGGCRHSHPITEEGGGRRAV